MSSVGTSTTPKPKISAELLQSSQELVRLCGTLDDCALENDPWCYTPGKLTAKKDDTKLQEIAAIVNGIGKPNWSHVIDIISERSVADESESLEDRLGAITALDLLTKATCYEFRKVFGKLLEKKKITVPAEMLKFQKIFFKRLEDKNNWWVRRFAIESLAKVSKSGDTEVIAKIWGLVEDPVKEVVLAAFKALAEDLKLWPERPAKLGAAKLWPSEAGRVSRGSPSSCLFDVLNIDRPLSGGGDSSLAMGNSFLQLEQSGQLVPEIGLLWDVDPETGKRSGQHVGQGAEQFT